jgi:hypothetical protein
MAIIMVISGTKAMVVAVTELSTKETEIVIIVSGSALLISPITANSFKSRREMRGNGPRSRRNDNITSAPKTIRTATSVTGGNALTAIFVNMNEVPHAAASAASNAYSIGPGSECGETRS